MNESRSSQAAAAAIPPPGSHKPVVAWQPSTRKPGRHAGGDHLQYGTLIVPVPRGAR